MPFQWNVQPYDLIDEMRAEYTQVILAGTNKMLNQLAPEVEQWMKDNAPWQDRSHNARDSLRARVLSDETEAATYASGLAKARAEDAKKLKKLNAERRGAAGSQTITVGRGDDARTTQTLGSLRTGGAAAKIALKRVPSHLSSVVAYKAGYKPEKVLIGQIKLSYGGDRNQVPYAVWLEVANQGRYAIIARAIDYWGGIFIQRLRQVARLKQFRDIISFGDIETPEQAFSDFVRREELWGEPYTPHDSQRRKMNVKRRARERRIRLEKEMTGTFKRKTRSDKGTIRKGR